MRGNPMYSSRTRKDRLSSLTFPKLNLSKHEESDLYESTTLKEKEKLDQ